MAHEELSLPHYPGEVLYKYPEYDEESGDGIGERVRATGEATYLMDDGKKAGSWRSPSTPLSFKTALSTLHKKRGNGGKDYQDGCIFCWKQALGELDEDGDPIECVRHSGSNLYPEGNPTLSEEYRAFSKLINDQLVKSYARRGNLIHLID
jgi:hypothetical protein